jgi:hypothetical protein
MERYAWPADAQPGDDANARGEYNSRHLPASNVRLADGSLPPVPEAVKATKSAKATKAEKAPKTAGSHVTVAPTGGVNLWLPIGPSNVLGGQASGAPPVAGRMKDIAVEPTVGQRAYAASASGGVWFTNDRGQSWSPLDAFSVSPNRETPFAVGNSLASGAIHVAWKGPADGSADIITVGTGEPGGRRGTPGGKMAGVGVLRKVGSGSSPGWSFEAPDLRGEAVYRVVQAPGDDARLFAATTAGLFVRQPTGVWEKATTLGLNSNVGTPSDQVVLDVAVTVMGASLRIWVAWYDEVRVAEVAKPANSATPMNLSSLSFKAVTLNQVASSSRLVLSAVSSNVVWVLGKRPATPAETTAAAVNNVKLTEAAHLWRIDSTLALASLIAIEINGLPPGLFMSSGDQSAYDMALTEHPTTAGRLFVAGATELILNEWNGAFYRLDVAATAATTTPIGKGTHADCHSIKTGPAPGGSNTAVWLGCDGGVFVSEKDGDANTFKARNSGLAVLQPGFVASHPSNDGIVVAGMQDNGTCERTGDTVWTEPMQGDGGGVAYNPNHANEYIAQNTKATWVTNTGFATPPVLRNKATAPAGQKNSEQIENDHALFYTGADALNHGGTVHLALGTDRVWYSDDFGKSWVTLPSGVDQRGAVDNVAKDVLQIGATIGVFGNVTESRRTFLCCTKDFVRRTQTDTVAARAGILTSKWSVPDVADPNHVRLNVLWNHGMAVINGTRPAAGSKWAWSIKVIAPIRQAIDLVEQAAVDSGAAVSFLPGVGLVNDLAPHDPKSGPHGSCYVATIGDAGAGPGHDIDTLWWYDGSGHFVPCGLRRTLDRGTWTGQQIAAPALSVLVDPDDHSIVYVGTSVGVVRGVFDGSGAEPKWAWKAFYDGLPEGAVHDLNIFKHSGIKLLRAALQARGVWEVDLSGATATATTYLRVFPTDTRRRRPTLLAGDTIKGAIKGATKISWDASPDVVFDLTAKPVPAAGLTETDVLGVPSAGKPGVNAANHFVNKTFKVHVLVHHRWFETLQAANVRVVLLRKTNPSKADLLLDGIWPALVTFAGGGAEPSPLPGGWVKAGATLTQSPPTDIDVRMPRAVTFDVTLTGVPKNSLVTFLAVVMSGADQITLAEALQLNASPVTTVKDLVLHSRHAAARTLRT